MQDKTVIFEEFARKAAQRLEERKKKRVQRLMVKSIGMEVEIRALSDAELHDCYEFSEDPIEVDRYTLYMASQTLQEAAKIMKAAGTLQQEYKITEMFSGAERSFLVRQVLELSGASGDVGIEVVQETEEIKNS